MLRTSFYQLIYGIRQDIRVTLKKARTSSCTELLFDTRDSPFIPEKLTAERISRPKPLLFDRVTKKPSEQSFSDHFFVSVLVALLSGARNEKNLQLSNTVYNRMKKLFPQHTNPLTSAAVLLANVSASSGETEKASDIRIQLHKSGAKKKTGLTWTAIDGQIDVSSREEPSTKIFVK